MQDLPQVLRVRTRETQLKLWRCPKIRFSVVFIKVWFVLVSCVRKQGTGLEIVSFGEKKSNKSNDFSGVHKLRLADILLHLSLQRNEPNYFRSRLKLLWKVAMPWETQAGCQISPARMSREQKKVWNARNKWSEVDWDLRGWVWDAPPLALLL